MNFSDGRAIAVGFDGASPTQILPNVQSLHYYKLCNGFVPEALVHTYFLSRSGFTGPLSGLRSGITFRWAKKCTGSRPCGGAQPKSAEGRFRRKAHRRSPSDTARRVAFPKVAGPSRVNCTLWRPASLSETCPSVLRHRKPCGPTP